MSEYQKIKSSLGESSSELMKILTNLNVVQIIRYGSNLNSDKDDCDIDLLVVVADTISYERFIIGKYDLVILSSVDFFEFVKKFDPIVTEPLLTGKTVLGNINKEKKTILEANPTKEICDYLSERANEIYSWTVSSSGGVDKLRLLLQTDFIGNILDNFTFIASYLAFSAYYRKFPKVITIKDLCCFYPKSLVAVLRQYKKEQNFEVIKMESILEKLEESLYYRSPSYNKWVLEGT